MFLLLYVMIAFLKKINHYNTHISLNVPLFVIKTDKLLDLSKELEPIELRFPDKISLYTQESKML